MEDLGCSKPTCTKIMRELDSENGIGLIEKKRRGLCKQDIIYVKNFSSVPDEKDSSKKIEISGEILLRYDKQITSDKNLIRPKKGSEGSLNISIQ